MIVAQCIFGVFGAKDTYSLDGAEGMMQGKTGKGRDGYKVMWSFLHWDSKIKIGDFASRPCASHVSLNGFCRTAICAFAPLGNHYSIRVML